jgi:two-component system, LuxR family, sensor kinase FixL
MNWITVVWPMVAAANLTLGLIELRIAVAQPPRGARLLLALSAFAMAACSGFELGLMRADTTAEAVVMVRGLNFSVGVILVTLTGFIWVYFKTGTWWLGLAPPMLYAVALAPNLMPGPDMTYRSIIGLRSVETFGGATFNVLEGVQNPWVAFAYLGALVLILFVVDASVRLWRRGGRRRALVVGGSVVLFIVAAAVQSELLVTRITRTPYMFSLAFLAILVAMVNELNADVLAAAQLSVELRESERRMELAGAAANLGMWAWDIIHNTLWATTRARLLFGLSDLAMVSLEKFASAVHPDDRAVRQQAIDRALATDNEYEVEYRVPLADGQIRWISSRGRVERDAAGKPVLVRGVVLDISARRGIEIEMQHLQNQLAHASRVSMMGQLASALAHELSQPLGAILRNTEAAELFLKHEPPDLEEMQAILVDIRRDDQRAGDVIDRLRSLLKRGSFVPRALSVSDLLDNVATLTRIECTARKAYLEVAATNGLPAVMGDPVHLQQVLLNLVLNATDAIQDLPAERRKVAVQAARRGSNEVEFAVSDLGPGIESGKLGRLFEPFYTTKPNGMGIGLSISRTIIEAHRGRIWAENNAKEGVTFRFTLPLAGEATSS